MKYYGVDMIGTFVHQRVDSLPDTYESTFEGRVVYLTSNDTIYVGQETDWIAIGNNATGQIPLSNGTLNTNLNADMVDGYHVGGSSGQVPLSNGTLNTNLNADMVDGIHNTEFATDIIIGGTDDAYISLKNYDGTVISTIPLPDRFNIIRVSGQVDLEPDTFTDILTFSSTGGITLTTTPSADTLNIGLTINDTVHGNLGGGSLHAAATTTVSGFMSSTDKSKTDQISTSLSGLTSNYHPKKSSGYSLTNSIISDNGTLATVHGSLTATAVYNAVYNDYADFKELDTELSILTYGKCYFINERGKLEICYKRCQSGVIGIATDTYGFSLGGDLADLKPNLVPISVGGWVLAYVDKEYKNGTPLTSSKNGYLTKISLFEKLFYPERIIGIYYGKEHNKTWNNVVVDNRHWVKVK